MIEPQHVAMMNRMMQETLLSGTARKAEIGLMAAGKTGTSQDFRDAWFMRCMANLVTGVWLGNDDNSPTKKATGAGLPVEVWTRFMRSAHQGVAVAGLPNSQRGGFMSNLFQTASQASAAPSTSASALGAGPAGRWIWPAPARTSAPPPNPSARPEPAAGLDGWLVDRMFGR